MPKANKTPVPASTLPTLAPITRGMPLETYISTVSPGSAGKSQGQLRREALEKTGINTGSSGQ